PVPPVLIVPGPLSHVNLALGNYKFVHSAQRCSRRFIKIPSRRSSKDFNDSLLERELRTRSSPQDLEFQFVEFTRTAFHARDEIFSVTFWRGVQRWRPLCFLLAR